MEITRNFAKIREQGERNCRNLTSSSSLKKRMLEFAFSGNSISVVLRISATIFCNFTESVQVQLSNKTREVLSLKDLFRWIVKNVTDELLRVRNHDALAIFRPHDLLTLGVVNEIPQFLWKA